MAILLAEKRHNDCDAKKHKKDEDHSQNIPPAKALVLRLKLPRLNFAVISLLDFPLLFPPSSILSIMFEE